MNNKVSSNKLLASLAVFRRLDKEGKKINEILSEFLVDIIKSNSLYQFTVSELNSLLEKTYDFQIPDAVIRTTLKKIDFIQVRNHQYTVTDNKKLVNDDLDEKQEAMLAMHTEILQKLYEYIEKIEEEVLINDKKIQIEQEFTNYILDSVMDNGYSNYISAFILDQQEDEVFMHNLELIKEGVILYTGLKFNPQMDLNKKWKSNLTIYLNTEIIFHLAGYNGSLYKELFNDFYKLVKEINRTKKHISLKYLPETQSEIKSFFYVAEKIASKELTSTFMRPAMKELLNGCQNRADIITKEQQLYDLINTYWIFEEEEIDDMYNQSQHKYNIADSALISKYSEEGNEEQIKIILKKLNYVSLKRQEREKNNFENIGYILLTENSKSKMISWDEDIKEQGDVPLATNLQFMTNKLWFKLNKGFGSNEYPASFKVITKAQTLLSAHLSEKLNQDYGLLQKNVENGKMNKEVAMSVLYELKNRSKLPEELCDTDISSVLATLAEKELDNYALLHENVVKKAKDEVEKNTKLIKSLESEKEEKKILLNEKKEILFKNEKLKSSLSEIQTGKTKAEKEAYLLKQKILNEKKKSYELLSTSKQEIIDTSDKEYNTFKRLVGFGFVIYYLSIFFAIDKYGWDVMEQWTWILTFAFPILFTVIYSFVKEKPFKMIELLEQKKKNILEKNYQQKNINLDEIEELLIDIKTLEDELKV